MPVSSTTRKFRLALLALAALLATGAAAAASPSASGDTPTPTTEPTASPTPYPQSRITVRFVRDGVPVTIVYSSAVPSADGVVCFGTSAAVLKEASELVIGWPLAGADQPYECAKGPPTNVTIQVNQFGSPDSFSAEVFWTGSDASVEVEVPESVVIASATPTSAPVSLPNTGGPWADESEPSGLVWMVSALAVAFAALGVAIAAARYSL